MKTIPEMLSKAGEELGGQLAKTYDKFRRKWRPAERLGAENCAATLHSGRRSQMTPEEFSARGAPRQLRLRSGLNCRFKFQGFGVRWKVLLHHIQILPGAGRAFVPQRNLDQQPESLA